MYSWPSTTREKDSVMPIPKWMESIPIQTDYPSDKERFEEAEYIRSSFIQVIRGGWTPKPQEKKASVITTKETYAYAFATGTTSSSQRRRPLSHSTSSPFLSSKSTCSSAAPRLACTEAFWRTPNPFSDNLFGNKEANSVGERYVVTKRDNWTCVNCGAKATQVHHTQYLGKNLSKEPIEWLESLCHSCHQEEHEWKSPAFARLWSVSIRVFLPLECESVLEAYSICARHSLTIWGDGFVSCTEIGEVTSIIYAQACPIIIGYLKQITPTNMICKVPIFI